MGACLVTALLFVYAPVLHAMVLQWWNISFYSYAFLIPVVSAYLVWIRRDRVLAIVPQPHYGSGSVLLTLGLLVLVIGQTGGINALQQISLLITLPGMILFLFGKSVLKALLLPITFLLFMIPIWEVVTDPLHVPFQAFSADLGVVLLRVVGIPVFQDGVFIHLPNITLEVARACSGVNYLIAVLATSIPLATIVLTDVRKRILLVMLAMIISVFANSLRVALIGVLAYYDLSGDLHGPYHVLHGVFVSLIGYIAIFGGLWALSRGQQVSLINLSALGHPERWNIEWKQVRTSWMILAVVLVLAGLFRHVDRSYPVVLRQNLSELSLDSTGWIGNEVSFIEKIEGADKSLSRVYRSASGREVRLAVWYFEAQTQGKELVSAGTAKLHSNAIRSKVRLGTQGEAEVNRVLRREGDKTHMIFFWYDINGHIIAGKHEAKIRTVFDAMINGRTNGALVWVAAVLPSEDQAGKDQTLTTLTDFLEDFYPVLRQSLPNPAD
jgi:EpsI family protein